MCRLFKLFCIVFTFTFLLSGCNKIDNRITLPTTRPTNIPSSEPSPSIKATVLTSIPTRSLDSLNNTEASTTKEELTNKPINNELCSEDEDVLLSFKIANSKKTASICISKQKSNYIIYRYGKSDDIELEYPDTTQSSWNKFTYSYYVRGGGTDNEGLDLNYLDFENGEFRYEIYEEYDSESNGTTIGITVTNLKTGEKTDIQGVGNSIKGSLIDLRNNDKMNIIIQ